MQRQKEHTLVVTDGPNVGQRYQLREMVSTVGRTAGNAIVLDSVQISRHHTQIQLTPTGATIEDIGSTNRTWVNDQRLVGSHATSGDRIRFADFVTMEYVVKESSGTEVLPSPMAGGPLRKWARLSTSMSLRLRCRPMPLLRSIRTFRLSGTAGLRCTTNPCGAASRTCCVTESPPAGALYRDRCPGRPDLPLCCARDLPLVCTPILLGVAF